MTRAWSCGNRAGDVLTRAVPEGVIYEIRCNTAADRRKMVACLPGVTVGPVGQQMGAVHGSGDKKATRAASKVEVESLLISSTRRPIGSLANYHGLEHSARA